LYKKRQFDAAIEKYNAAMALDPSNPNYLLNRSAAYFEQGNFGACNADCDQAIKMAQEVHTAESSAVLGKAYARYEMKRSCVD
jgi:tetratricopeptide (TPR) repeat protein